MIVNRAGDVNDASIWFVFIFRLIGVRERGTSKRFLGMASSEL